MSEANTYEQLKQWWQQCAVAYGTALKVGGSQSYDSPFVRALRKQLDDARDALVAHPDAAKSTNFHTWSTK